MEMGLILNVDNPAMSKLIWKILYMQCSKALYIWPPILLPQVPFLWCYMFLSFFYTPFWFKGTLGFPHSSAGKESTCNAGDPGSIPGSGRSPGEGIGYPLQYSWASLWLSCLKNPPAMWETWVWSLDWENHLEKGKATHSSIQPWRIPWTV